MLTLPMLPMVKDPIADKAKRYFSIKNKIEKLEAERETLRLELIEEHKKGVDFKPLKLRIYPRYSSPSTSDLAALYEKETGQKPPTKTIPARQELNVAMLKAWSKADEIKSLLGEKEIVGYTVSRIK